MSRRAKSLATPEPTEPLPETLLEAIAAAPDDDGPRLVAADWFAEHGQEARAEVIVVQCQLHRLDLTSPAREPLETRTLALLKRATPAWRPPVPHLEFVMSRGFPGGVMGEPADILAAEPTLRALRPPLREIWLTNLSDVRVLEMLLATELWAAARHLTLDGLTDLSAALLFESGRLTQLESISVERSDDLAPQSWRLLAQNDGLGRLQRLRLHNANAGLWTRAAPSLPSLAQVSLELCKLSPGELKSLARSECWKRLEALGVMGATLATEGGNVFSAQPPACLRSLDLSWCHLGANGLRALADSEGLHLHTLKLRQNALKGAALAPLLDAPCTVGLQWLDVRGNEVDEKTLSKLKERFGAGLLS